ncbi:DUF6881 domain-containing protein [Streptomyces sp. DSM 118148]|uniref:DUF6881 domain-containing protein n=1 Tax=Streptomyces sp. DSM 118148 TaxID=3448667 RepID=UPI004040111B
MAGMRTISTNWEIIKSAEKRPARPPGYPVGWTGGTSSHREGKVLEYWRIAWLHDFQSEPTVLFNEIGDDGYEVRKVQHYRGGRKLRADVLHESAEIGLSEIPVGAIEDVANQPEFQAALITEAAFEEAWRSASWATCGPNTSDR